MPGREIKDSDKTKLALIMTGGGARAAYQIGVLKAIARMVPRDTATPFGILCGTSAGAINATALACYAGNFRDAVRRLVVIWANFHSSQVYISHTLGILKTGLRWLLTMMLAGIGRRNPLYLLDRTPLRKLLDDNLPIDMVRGTIRKGYVHALSVTASGYNSQQSVTFFDGHDSLSSWQRFRRVGCACRLRIEHLMASSAIPFLFEPVKVNREFFGDGSMRQIAPVSPALHLGAEKVFIIGNRPETEYVHKRSVDPPHPTISEIAGHALDSIFLDALETDIERLRRINRTLSLIPQHHLSENGIDLRHIDIFVVSPSQDLGELATEYVRELPRPVRMLLRGIGVGKGSSASFISYMLFEKGYCRRLIQLGYEDAMKKRDEIKTFLGL